MKIADIIRELREKGIEVFVTMGNDAYTLPITKDKSVWHIVVPDFVDHADTQLVHELGHIYLASMGYEVFGIAPTLYVRDIVEENDLPALQLLFNAVADVAVEILMNRWGYYTEGEYSTEIVDERSAAGKLFLYAITGKEEVIINYFSENSWQYKLAKKLREVYTSDKTLEEKLDSLVEVLNGLLPFEVDRHMNIKLKD